MNFATCNSMDKPHRHDGEQNNLDIVQHALWGRTTQKHPNMFCVRNQVITLLGRDIRGVFLGINVLFLDLGDGFSVCSPWENSSSVLLRFVHFSECVLYFHWVFFLNQPSWNGYCGSQCSFLELYRLNLIFGVYYHVSLHLFSRYMPVIYPSRLDPSSSACPLVVTRHLSRAKQAWNGIRLRLRDMGPRRLLKWSAADWSWQESENPDDDEAMQDLKQSGSWARRWCWQLWWHPSRTTWIQGRKVCRRIFEWERMELLTFCSCQWYEELHLSSKGELLKLWSLHSSTLKVQSFRITEELKKFRYSGPTFSRYIRHPEGLSSQLLRLPRWWAYGLLHGTVEKGVPRELNGDPALQVGSS